MKYKSLENSRIFDDLTSEDMETLLSENNTKFLKPNEIYDNMSEFIENFEQTRKIKKVKNSKVKGVEEFYEGENHG